MKKIFAITAAILLLLSFTACGNMGDSEIDPPKTVNGSETGNTNSTTSTVSPNKAETPTITETVLVDEQGVKITAKSLKDDSLFGPEIKLLIENNSGKDLTFQARNSSVNGYMISTMMSVDVADGKKANDAMTFSNSELEACGIDTIADMEFSFHIFTTEDWDTYLDTSVIQLKTSAAETYEYTYDDSGDIAYEKNEVKIVVKGLQDDSILGPGIVVYIENTGNKNITVQARTVSINGFMVDPLFSSDVLAGKRCVDSITFLSSDLEENEITEIETVELSFHIFNSENWNTIADTDTVTITF